MNKLIIRSKYIGLFLLKRVIYLLTEIVDIFFMDNASYHLDEETMTLLEEFRIPVMYFGPHSYDAAPIETFFSWLKRVNLNPDQLP